MRKRRLIAFAFLLLLPCRQFATCIVIIAIKGGICAASDSKSNLKDIYGRSGGSTNIQKIFVKNNVGFAVAGHADQLLRQQAEAVIVPGRNLWACADSFGVRMRMLYTTLMAVEKKTSPTEYKFFLKNALAEVAFFEVKNATPTLLLAILRMKEVKGKTLISDSVYNRPDGVYMGITDHLANLSVMEMNQMMNKFNGRPDLLCADLVQLERSNHNEEIGCPIQTFVWTQAGYHWGDAPCN